MDKTLQVIFLMAMAFPIIISWWIWWRGGRERYPPLMRLGISACSGFAVLAVCLAAGLIALRGR